MTVDLEIMREVYEVSRKRAARRVALRLAQKDYKTSAGKDNLQELRELKRQLRKLQKELFEENNTKVLPQIKHIKARIERVEDIIKAQTKRERDAMRTLKIEIKELDEKLDELHGISEAEAQFILERFYERVETREPDLSVIQALDRGVVEAKPMFPKFFRTKT